MRRQTPPVCPNEANPPSFVGGFLLHVRHLVTTSSEIQDTSPKVLLYFLYIF